MWRRRSIRGLAGESEALELASFDFLGDGVAGEEGDAEAFAGGTLDRLAGVELPDSLQARRRRRKRAVGDLAGARARLAHEQRLPASASGFDLAFGVRSRPGLATPTISSERNGSSSTRSSTAVSPTRASWTRPASRRSMISPVEAISTSTVTFGWSRRKQPSVSGRR